LKNNNHSNPYQKELIKRLHDQSATIGIIGMGYVGIPLALTFTRANFKVKGFDIDPEKVDKINRGISYIKYLDHQRITQSVEAGLLSATSDYADVGEVDAVILCLPTPLRDHREPDLSFVTGTLEQILPYLRRGQVLSMESTTYPGTTEEELQVRLEDNGFEVGGDFFLIYSPEREDPGNPHFQTSQIPRIVGGITENCLEVGEALYKKVTNRIVPMSSTRAAELTKLLENIYRAVNIGLVNEMKIVADRMNIDIWEVIDAAATKPFGFTPFYPGPGWGGHCIPIDPFYLTWKAREYGINTRFIELSGEVNTEMPSWVLHKIMDGLNDREKPLKNSNVLVLGLSYKKNIDDIRESPSVKLMETLKQKGARVHYADPHIPVFPRMREHYFDLTSTEVTPANLQNMDAVIICTDHDAFDFELILQHADLIVDTRGIYRNEYPNVVKA